MLTEIKFWGRNFLKNSLISQLIIRIRELIFLIRLFVSTKFHQRFRNIFSGNDSDALFCEAILLKVGGSISRLIPLLPDQLRQCVEVFYLVLRGLDTLEDDPTAFRNKEDRIEALKYFHTHLNDPNWNLKGIGGGHERTLLENFDSVIRTFLKIRMEFQEIITDITRRMGNGMAEIIDAKLDGTQGTKTVEEYNKYCYYVAGLIAEGLQRLLAISEGNESLAQQTDFAFAHAFGSLLQKNNIIRDFLVDYSDGRSFWPIPIWSKYATTLGDLIKPVNSSKALNCLNELVIDALDLVPLALEYVTLLTNPNMTQFNGVLILMNLSSLAKCYNNPNVFTGVVKIRKCLAAYIFYNSNNLDTVLEESLGLIEEILDKTNAEDVLNRNKILAVHDRIKESIKSRSGLKKQIN